MLSRRKPLAHFSDAYPADPNEEIFPELAFAPYVANGTFEARDYVELLAGPPLKDFPEVKGIRHLFFAPPHEAWRIDAYLVMMMASKRSGWSEGFERLEGLLLGYTNAEIDAWLEHLRRLPEIHRVNWLRRQR
jgi:hypothetical protein